MARALTLHFQAVAHWVVEFVTRALRNGGEMYVVLINPPEQNPWQGLRVRCLGRTHPDDDQRTKDWIRQGARGGEAYFYHWLPFYLSRLWVYAWLSPNEPQPMADEAFVEDLNAFLVRWAVLMRVHGFLTAGPQLGVGWPFLGFEGEPRGSDVPRLAEAFSALDIWTFHEYGWPHMDDAAGFHCLRYRETVRQLLALGVQEKLVIITECGLDGILENGLPHSWKSQGISFEQYLRQLAWYDGELQEDRVPGAAIFTAVPSFPWGDYEIGQAEAWRLADWLADDPPTWVWEPGDVSTPSTDPPDMPTSWQIVDISGKLAKHPAKRYDTRSLEDISEIVAHHTGMPANAHPPLRYWKRIATASVEKRDWPGCPYHVGVAPDGTIHQLNSLETVAYHAGSHNRRSVGIAWLGCFTKKKDDRPTPEQMAATRWLLSELYSKLGLGPGDVRGHREIHQTVCPGWRWDECKGKLLN